MLFIICYKYVNFKHKYMKILKKEKHPNWDKAVIITFEDGSVKVVPTVEYYNDCKEVKDSKCDKLIPIEWV
jgi:hypothetical protein